jgi:hypothetical protein
MNDFIIFDEIISTEPSVNWLDYLGQSNVNLVNLHASIYALLLVHSDDESLSGDEQKTLDEARDILDQHISHDNLFDIMGDEVGSYDYDPQSVLKYAVRIIDFYKGDST